MFDFRGHPFSKCSTFFLICTVTLPPFLPIFLNTLYPGTFITCSLTFYISLSWKLSQYCNLAWSIVPAAHRHCLKSSDICVDLSYSLGCVLKILLFLYFGAIYLLQCSLHWVFFSMPLSCAVFLSNKFKPPPLYINKPSCKEIGRRSRSAASFGPISPELFEIPQSFICAFSCFCSHKYEPQD